MSAISLAYDALNTLIGTTLPAASGWAELINPYVPESNDELTYEKAWGLAFGAGNNSNRVIGCEMSIQRSFTVTLCRKTFAGVLNRGPEQLIARKTAEKALFEDLKLIVNELEKNVTVNNSTPIIKTVYVADSGLEFIRDDSHNLLMIRAEFQTEYFEKLV